MQSFFSANSICIHQRGIGVEIKTFPEAGEIGIRDSGLRKNEEAAKRENPPYIPLCKRGKEGDFSCPSSLVPTPWSFFCHFFTAG
jgi:hypothetical protein